MKTSYTSLLFFLLSCFATLPSIAQDELEISVNSKILGRKVSAFVYVPETPDYDKGRKHSVLYVLHGYTDDHMDWPERYGGLRAWSDMQQYIIVCPQGFNSWFLNSPADEKSQYEKFFFEEFIPYVEDYFKAEDGRMGRAITGHSMGGQGALRLALARPDMFRAAGSMAGAVDFNKYKGKYNMEEVLGPYNEKTYKEFSVLNMEKEFKKAKKEGLELIIDCGIDDNFYSENLALHKKLLDMDYDHTFISAPGGHGWNYWTKTIDYQIQFFRRFLID